MSSPPTTAQVVTDVTQMWVPTKLCHSWTRDLICLDASVACKQEWVVVNQLLTKSHMIHTVYGYCELLNIDMGPHHYLRWWSKSPLALKASLYLTEHLNRYNISGKEARAPVSPHISSCVIFVLTVNVFQVVYLFFMNRYLIPIGFIINIVDYNLQDWSLSVSTAAYF